MGIVVVVLIVDMERGGGGVVENQVDFQVEEVGGVEKDRLLNFFDIGMEHVHGLVHVSEFELLAGWQVNGCQPTIPYAQFGFRHTEPIGDHGQQSPFQQRPAACSLRDGLKAFFQTQFFPQSLNDQWTAEGEGLRDFHVGRQADWSGWIPISSQWIIKPQAADTANGLTKTHQLLAVKLVNPAEVVDDFGDGLAGVGMSLVMGELEIFDDRAVLVGAFGDS